MTGFLLFLLLVLAIAIGLEAQHRHQLHLGPVRPVGGELPDPYARTTPTWWAA